METMDKIVIESKLNLLSDELQIMLWDEFCEQGINDAQKIYRNNDDFYKTIVNKKSLHGLVRIVSYSEAYSPDQLYATMEYMNDHKVYGEDYLLASANNPIELMKLSPTLYDEFIDYCAEWFFR